MDTLEADPEPDEIIRCLGEGEEDWDLLPAEPTITIVDVECISIDSGDATVQRMAQWMVEHIETWEGKDLQNPDHAVWAHAIVGTKRMLKEDAEQFNERSVIEQHRENVNIAMSRVTGNLKNMMENEATPIDTVLLGKIKKRINTRKKRALGEAEKTVPSYQAHYQWIRNLQLELKETGQIPSWLS
jgi:hypothetical protein